jgi:hypothetical protein
MEVWRDWVKLREYSATKCRHWDSNCVPAKCKYNKQRAIKLIKIHQTLLRQNFLFWRDKIVVLFRENFTFLLGTLTIAQLAIKFPSLYGRHTILEETANKHHYGPDNTFPSLTPSLSKIVNISNFTSAICSHTSKIIAKICIDILCNPFLLRD